jgi:hypothetical protein
MKLTIQYILLCFSSFLLSLVFNAQSIFQLTEIKDDKNVRHSELSIEFRGPSNEIIQNICVLVILNADSIKTKTDDFGILSFNLIEGVHQINIVVPFMKELKNNRIQIKNNRRYYYKTILESEVIDFPEVQYNYDKPVIYLYPTEKQEVTVEVDFSGAMGFTYPKYSDSWNIVANPNGKLEFENKLYNYLFWEGAIHQKLEKQTLTTGFVIHSDTLVSFLENSLYEIGLIDSEVQDFITYWAPFMFKNEFNFIHFQLNEVCDKIAKLNVNPKPESMLRVYMIWNEVTNTEMYKVEKQKLTKIQRNGFTLVEWGGAQLQEKVVLELVLKTK